MDTKYKILCVDDEPAILEIYEMFLEEKYDVLKATNIKDAYQLVKENSSKLIYIFSDFKMPEGDGFEFREQLIKNGYELPFAIITGFYNLEMAERAMELRIASFVNKPINQEDVFKLIDDLGLKRIETLKEEKEMVCSFINESSPMLDEIESLILALEENPSDMNTLNTYFRLLHTIKGTAACVGLKTLPKFTHAYEDLISLAKENKIAVTKDIADLFLFGLDRLKFMYAEIIGNQNFEFEIETWLEQLNSYKSKGVSDHVRIETIQKETHDHQETKKTSEKLPIPIETLDSFMELSGKLTILRNTIYKATAKVEMKYTNDKDIETLSGAIDDLCKITSLVQKQISEMRKVSADVIIRPLKRVVRDTSKELNKNVELNVENEHLKIDNTVAKIISNSLVHLVRNSIDHGIEMPDARVNKGKSSIGTINLKIIEDGDNNIVTISDDGAGLNKKRILSKAIEKKIISEQDAKQLSDEEIYNLIFASGFSTAQTVSDISGRGVGMDMVKSSVESIGGKIQINSKEDHGSTFTLNLPQPKNVLINKTLMIEESEEIFSIPTDEIVEVVKITEENYEQSIFSISQHFVLKRYEEIIPIIKLQNALKPYLNLPNFKPTSEMIAVIVKHNNHKIGIIVDKVHDIEESVVRKIKPVLNVSPIYTGVTYFGDDDLSLVLNIEHLINENISSIKNISSHHKNMNAEKTSTSKSIQEYFTFKSLENTFCLSREKIFRIEIIPTNNIQMYYDNYFMKYREEIVKILSLNHSHLTNIKNSDHANILLINHEKHIYGLYIDEFNEFIESEYPLESSFSKSDILKGSIIYQDQILYVIDENQLDSKAFTSEEEKLELIMKAELKVAA